MRMGYSLCEIQHYDIAMYKADFFWLSKSCD